MICNGSPSIQRRTDKMTPNGGCPAIFTSMNGSCSCLTTGYSDTNTFEFYVRLRGDEGMEYYPKSLDSSTILAIDSIRTLLVPPDLTTLKIVGEGMYPQTIKFVLQDRGVPGLTLPIAMVKDGTLSLTTVSIENIDMSSVAQSVAAFYPSTTINITLRNCNLDQFGYNFFKGLNSVRYLDLSSNHLTAPYVGSSIAHTCSNQFCAVEVLNLTNNSIATFPTIVFNVDNLQELYIAKNAISDFNITSTVFRAIQALVAFDADLPSNAATCLDGSWHTAHNRNFCVLNMLDAKAENSSLGHSRSMLIGLIGGGCVLAVIGIISIVWRCKKDEHLLLTKLDSFIQDCGDTRDEDDNRVQVNPVFLNDPVIITNRLEYKLIKMGQCVSTGGFGVVFMGVYRGRRTLRPQFSVDCPKAIQDLADCCLLQDPKTRPTADEIIDTLQHIKIQIFLSLLLESSMLSRWLCSLLLAQLCGHFAFSQPLHEAPASASIKLSLSSSPYDHQTQDLCTKFALICDFVVQSCSFKEKNQLWLKNATNLDTNSKCVNNFSLLDQHNATLTKCIEEYSKDDSDRKHQAMVCQELYSTWHQQNTCNQFHATEAKAATECSGFYSHRPWTQETLPLFCQDAFTMYKTMRHDLDRFCERTSNSDAFWEGYVNYVASDTCKHYYDMMREANEQECGKSDREECQTKYQWYVDNQKVVETECYEIRASKAFYHGFYTWKKQQS
ncbi:hypothetical protein CCR75_001789 [Bremia lactucae]|uniref:Protein kinase domain-containing protein n=1 Tax=Bremia lactucae TaxID=4779 RepID=A0A976FRB2_BRELC|nr:hypothetical protein CCR75_001789 [Bremia lactucae]